MRTAPFIPQKRHVVGLGLPARMNRRPSFKVTSKRTIREFANHWLATYAKVYLTPNSYRNYVGSFRNHILPALGNMRMVDLTREQVRNFLAEKHASGLSKATLYCIVSPLRQMYNDAIDDGELLFNPAAQVGRYTQSRRDRRPINPFTLGELRQFLDTALEFEPHWYPLFLCAATTGIRLGELIALRPRDVDFDSMFIHVSRNSYQGKFSSPKNHRVRAVDMNNHLAHVLYRLIMFKKFNALLDEEELPPTERQKNDEVITRVTEKLLFTRLHGGKVDPSTLHEVYQRTLSRGGLRRIRFHDLRHTYVTLLIQQGENLAYIRDQLGHYSIELTIDTYGHLVPGSNRLAVDRLMDSIRKVNPRKAASPRPPLLSAVNRRADRIRQLLGDADLTNHPHLRRLARSTDVRYTRSKSYL